MEIREIPLLRDPIMLIAFSGWSDAGEASTGAITHILATATEDAENSFAPTLIAEIDSEEYYDFQVNRPLINVDDALIRTITWPGLQIFGVHNSHGDRDFVLVRGVEPSMKWQTFAHEILDLVDDLEINLVVTLGSMLADTPHTRSIPVTGTAAHPDMAARLKVEMSKYEGPTGILGVLAHGCIERGIDTVSLWAAVPHYASAAHQKLFSLSSMRSKI
jgi:proteasome assembly chaperone (PAC2) family protein